MSQGVINFLIFWAIFGLIIGLCAKRKNRSGLLWGILGGSLIVSMIFVAVGCGGGSNSSGSNISSQQTAIISGTVSVPEGTPIQTAYIKYFEYIPSLVTFANAITDTVPLEEASIKIYRMSKDGRLSDVNHITVKTDKNGNYTLPNVPRENNLIIVAIKKTKDTQGNNKIVTLKGLTSIKDSDLGKEKAGVSLSFESTLTVSAIRAIAIQRQLPAKDIDQYQIEELKTPIANAVANEMEPSEIVDLIARDENVSEEDYEDEIQQEIENLRNLVAELDQKVNDILSKGTIAGEIKDSKGNLLENVTVTVSGGTLTAPITTVTNSSGQYVVRIPASIASYTAQATSSAYQDGEKTGIIVSASTVVIVNFTMEIEEKINNPPIANISSPTNNANFIHGISITLEGTASDPEDGNLPENSLVWSSSIDGDLGIGTSLTINELTVGTHTITLTATDSDGKTGSEHIVITISIPPPASPSATATPGDERVTISWNSVDGATSYNIYWSTATGVTKDIGTKISNVTSPYIHSGLTNGNTYYYVITAQNISGEGDESTEVSAIPIPPPASPTVTATPGDQQVTISWGSVDGATSYNICWSTTPGVTKDTGTKISNVTSPYIHTPLTNGSAYYYVITAQNISGEGDESTELSIVPIPPPDSPSATATPRDGRLIISWNSVDGAASYNIYWSTISGVTKDTGTKIAGVVSPYIHSGLTNGNPYYYVITAQNISGESDESNELSVVPIPPPASPTVTATPGDEQVTISWGSVDGATSYNIYWSTAAGVTKGIGTKISDVTSPYVHSGLTNGSAYYYVVTAENISGEGGESGEVSAILVGLVYTWGNNGYGQLGDGTTNQKHIPSPIAVISDIIAIAGGEIHSIALKSDGTVWAWGYNNYGQLGDGTTGDRHTPVQVIEISDVIDISRGGMHTIALKSDGTVWTWGWNRFGQLGDGTITDRHTPIQVNTLTDVIDIDGEGVDSIALKSDGTVWRWGTNTFTPVQVSGISDVVAIVKGATHSIALKSDGTVWTWGENNFGQLGDGTTTARGTPVQVSGLNDIIDIGGGYSHTVALKSDGTAWAWGNNEYGQLGDGTTTDRYTPVQVSGITDVIDIIARYHITVALKSDGTAWAWGNNEYGQLGDGTTTDRQTPVQINGINDVIAIAGGREHTIILTERVDITPPSTPTEFTATAVSSSKINLSWNPSSDNFRVKGYKIYRDGVYLKSVLTTSTSDSGLNVSTEYCYTVTAYDAAWNEAEQSSQACATPSNGLVWAWGQNDHGQIGDDTSIDRHTPVLVNELRNVISIAGGFGYSIALKSDGTVWAWGDNGRGKLGDGTTSDRRIPVQLSDINDVIAIDGGVYHTVALKSDGTVWTWGWNYYGQFGDGTASDTESHTPLKVSGLSGVIAIAEKGEHTIVLRSDGTVWGWGNNGYGQLGDGTFTNRYTPVLVNGLADVIAIDVGDHHTIALRSDGTVWTWGHNNYGQLGDDTTTNSPIPVQLNGINNVIAIAGGGYHTIALRSDGTVWTWGFNNYGQLGDDTTTDRHTPVQVNTINDVVVIAGDWRHTMALKSDGTVWTWGLNQFGRLGDGTITNRHTPVQVSGLTEITAITGGTNHTIALKGIWDTDSPSVPTD